MLNYKSVAPMYGSNQSKSQDTLANRQVEEVVDWIMQIDNMNAAAPEKPQELRQYEWKQERKRQSAYEPSRSGERIAEPELDSLKALFGNLGS
jgi:hypothetical protein